MSFKNYNLQVALRLTLLFLAMLALAFAIAWGAQTTLLLVLSTIILVTAVSVVRYMHKTIRDLESFLSGFRFGDFQQSYTIRHLGNSFHKLEILLKLTGEKFKAMRSKQEQQAVYFQSLVQHLPLPFLIIHNDGRVEILNMATRRTFNVAEITNTDQLAQFGASFQRDVLQIQPGESLLTSITMENTEEYFILTSTAISLESRQQKLVALQNVQGELDATELATWQNLLRVTSHEILNSLAPVTSCAQTAESLVKEVLETKLDDDEVRSDLEDIRDAIETMARRSEGLRRFVQSYRQLTRMPPPKLQKITVGDYFQRLELLLKDELAQKKISVHFQRKPASLTLLADEDMLDQAMINLVRNATDAVRDQGDGKIDIRAYVDGKQRVILEVTDNGPGIEPEAAKNIFVPFFTTKKQGSGVGLTLVRYIMLTHGGSALYSPGAEGGSVFRLIF
jgi:two-component system nitrogen regulation sensor histidine kinase NtrY